MSLNGLLDVPVHRPGGSARIPGMKASQPLRAAIVTALAGLIFTGYSAPASAAGPSFGLRPAVAMDAPFRWSASDYALRCEGRPVRVRIRGARGWMAKVNGGVLRSGGFTERIPAAAGRRSTVTFTRNGQRRRFHLRCLPRDFPDYEFRRLRPGGPAFLFIQMDRYYPTIFNSDGVPVWWFKASGVPDNFQLMPDGTVSLDPVDDRSFQVGTYEVRSLAGRFIRRVGNHDGGTADIHELLRLPNGNYVFGRQVLVEGVDTSDYGGSADSTVVEFQILEVTPGGRVVWRWNSADHIGLAETGRWWDEPILDTEPYDVKHWNSVEIRGRYMLLSFRHLDAVYKIDRRTGRIVWKLGGTPTPERLDVVGDPLGNFPLGAQHDARFLDGNTISIYDNRSALPQPARVVSYRINESTGRARLLRAFGDPRTPISVCCGSARRVGRSWVVGWGGNSLIGGYDLRGRRLWSLTIDKFTYRANYATSKQLKVRRVRRAMDAITRRGAAG